MSVGKIHFFVHAFNENKRHTTDYECNDTDYIIVGIIVLRILSPKKNTESVHSLIFFSGMKDRETERLLG